MKRWWIAAGAASLSVAITWITYPQAPIAVLVQNGERIAEISLDTVADCTVEGTVAYQGPALDTQDDNWKPESTYRGVLLKAVLDYVGGMQPGEDVAIVAADGYTKYVPYSAVYEETVAGEPILALDNGDPEWEGAPMLVFLAPDGRFSNEDMLTALGEEYAHRFDEEHPSTTGLMVGNVFHVIVNYDGGGLPELTAGQPVAVQQSSDASDILLTVVRGGEELVYTLQQVEELEAVTGQGTFTTSAGGQYTATYTGVPFATLIGNAPPDATVRVTAADEYSMNYEVGALLEQTDGTWILAYKENGEYMPFDPGYFRVVQVGESNSHFTSSLSARMVEKIEVLGDYAPYTLTVVGTNSRVFRRFELEAGIGCPCHTATVVSTTKGTTAEYTGLPLWRLIAYADDELFPPAEKGIFYEDEHFNAALAEQGYTVVLVASDGFSQTVASDWISREDRFIVAFKKDGAFLDPGTDGYMRFTFDDAVLLPDGTQLKPVRFLSEIRIQP